MAMFHFRLKSDKKPDGTKISAVQHVKYINREENSSSQAQWEKKNKFVGNFITTAEVKDVLDGQNTLLYKTDDFGSIRNSANGIEVTENASETTIAIAILLSNAAMNNQPIILHGSPQFQKAVLQAAIQQNLNPKKFFRSTNKNYKPKCFLLLPKLINGNES